MKFNYLALAASLGLTVAQRPNDTSICDYYTTALLKENNATNQLTLVTLVVNTAVIGNYTQPNVLAVPGILNPNATYNDTAVNLVKYFSGMLLSTNEGGSSGVSVNFLDGGGAAPLEKNMPASDTTSHQYTLLTHLYSYFGTLLGCSQIGNGTIFPAYMGDKSMYEVHKFMGIDAFEFQYFVEQVGLAALSFGVAVADAEAVGLALQDAFGYRCAPAETVIKSQGSQLQAICIESNCPPAPTPDCSAYGAIPAEPATAMPSSSGSMASASATMTSAGSSGTAAASGTASASVSVATSTGMAAQFGPAAAVVGLAALAFAL